MPRLRHLRRLLGPGVKSADQIEIITGDKDSEEYAEKVRGILGRG